VVHKAEDTSKGLLHSMVEKVVEAKDYMAEMAHEGIEKVEHLGTVIKETVMPPSKEEQAARQVQHEADEMLREAKQGAQHVAGRVEQEARDVKNAIKRS
jgi:cell division septum initiation protein DivIVA